MKNLAFYIANLTTGTYIYFDVAPDGHISDGVNASYDSMQVPGSTRTIYGYENTGPRTISFSVRLHDDYCRYGIKTTVNYLRALAYPEYGGFVYPPQCYVRIGNLMRFTGICTSVGFSWDRPIRNNMYLVADVSLTFDVIYNFSPSAREVEEGVG